MTDRFYTTTSEIESSRLLWEKGVRLAEHTKGYHTTVLYQLYDAYIEVVWHTHFNVIVKVCRFTDVDHLAPYLEKISLNNLLDETLLP